MREGGRGEGEKERRRGKRGEKGGQARGKGGEGKKAKKEKRGLHWWEPYPHVALRCTHTWGTAHAHKRCGSGPKCCGAQWQNSAKGEGSRRKGRGEDGEAKGVGLSLVENHLSPTAISG